MWSPDVLSLIFLLAVGTQATPAPSTLLNEADATPMELAWILVDASIPVGIEVRAKDRGPFALAGYEPRDKAANVTRFKYWSPLREPARVEASPELLQNLAARFNSSHADYRANVMDGVFVIRPVVPDRIGDAYLERTYTGGEIRASDPYLAAFRIFDPEFAPPRGGLLGSCPVPDGFFSPVAIAGPQLKAIDLLNQLVRQLRGVGWLVIIDREQPDTVQYGWATQHGGTCNSQILGPLRAR